MGYGGLHRRKKETRGKEFKNRPPMPYTTKELDAFLDLWIVGCSLSPTRYCSSLWRKRGEILVSTICITLYNIPLWNVRPFVDLYIVGSKKALLSSHNQRFRGTLSPTTKAKGWQQWSSMRALMLMKKSLPCPSAPL